MVIINGELHPMVGTPIERGYLLIKDGKINEIGSMDHYVPIEGEDVLDAEGAMILPGFVDGHCHIGMCEDSLGLEGDDGNEITDPTTPQLRAVDAINPQDIAFGEALGAGITTVVTGPGSANPISGQFCAMKTWGKRVDTMVLRSPVAMKFALGENPKMCYHEKSQTPNTRMATAALIREQLAKAKRYGEDQQAAEDDEDLDRPEYDAKCEALLPVLSREIKAHFHCHRADDMFTAVRISEEFGLDYVLVHGTDGHLIADELSDLPTGILCGPMICTRTKPELKNMTLKNAGVLASHHVKVALTSDYPEMPIDLLSVGAGLAAREGLDGDEALRALTINPAQLCGIADRVGSLEVGKDADLVFFRENPLTIQAKPVHVIINGTLAF